MPRSRFILLLLVVLGFLLLRRTMPVPQSGDDLRDWQTRAIKKGRADWAHWGTRPGRYADWSKHTNRLIPVYTFGCNLNAVRGEQSVYRDEGRIEKLYGHLPAGTLNPTANYFDQTDIYHLQQAAIAAGKTRIILFVFDGMDWQTTQAAAIYKTGSVAYTSGRGTGLHFQDYRGIETDFGFCVTSPHNEGTKVDVDAQTVVNAGGKMRGGYDASLGGDTPWSQPRDPAYLISKSAKASHAYTDSSSSATSMTAGIKTYNNGVNVTFDGQPVETIAHQMQRKGWSIGVVTSVPISHATPAAAYAVNVDRDDFQDLTRDMLGLPSISHRREPLPGIDVLLGCGWGETVRTMKEQGKNFVRGNKYLAAEDLQAIDVDRGGKFAKYVVAQRTPGQAGVDVLRAGVERAVDGHHRLFGYFGYEKTGHLPYRTADGNFSPTLGVKRTAERYAPEDLRENPTLAEMAVAALDVLSRNDTGFWLMIEAGDVDWANHDNNLDNSIGAVLSGDAAVKAVTNWIEQHGGWNNTVLIVTADHGHYLNISQPQKLAAAGKQAANVTPAQQPSEITLPKVVAE